MEDWGLRYRIPGKGGWKEKYFQTEAARTKFVGKLVEREGDDVEVSYSDPRKDLDTASSTEAKVKSLRQKYSKAMITSKVRDAVMDMGFDVSSIQDREDGCFIRTNDTRQLRPMYEFLDSNGFDARLKVDGVFVADTGYTGR